MASYELDVRGPTEQPVKLKLSLSETVAQLRSHIAERLNLKPEEVFLVADEAMSQELRQFSHEPDEANKYPVARLVKPVPGATVNFQIGRSAGVGPFIPVTAVASEFAKVKTGTDTFLISRLRATAGAHMSNATEAIVRTDRDIHAEISEISADGQGTDILNIIATSQHLINRKLVEKCSEKLSDEHVFELLKRK